MDENSYKKISRDKLSELARKNESEFPQKEQEKAAKPALNPFRSYEYLAKIFYSPIYSSESVELAICFLEENNMFWGSGYLKEACLHQLKRTSLSPQQIKRLQDVILARIDQGCGREYAKFMRLAIKIQDPKFKERVELRLLSEDEGIRRRASWLIHKLINHPEKLKANSPKNGASTDL